jgi:hypothetical protein
MNPLTPVLAAAFRRAAMSIDPTLTPAESISPSRVDAWVTVYTVRGQTRWLDAAVAAAQPGASLGAGSDQDWLQAWCAGWGSRAAPAFRQRADHLAGGLDAEPSSVGPLLAYWRITGRSRWLDLALERLPSSALPDDPIAAEAFRQAWRATADEGLRNKAAASYGDPAQLALGDLRGAAEILGHHWLTEDLISPLLDKATPETIIQATAALGLPLLRLDVHWWLESELREGPVAEAVTYPWPALELSFSKLRQRDQVRFLPELDGRPCEAIIDAGVVGVGLAEIINEADRSAFLEAAGTRRRSLRRR